MDHKSVEDRDLVDLESGGSGCEDAARNETKSGNGRATNMFGLASGVFSYDGLDKGYCCTDYYSNLGKSSDDEYDNIELLIDSKFGGENGERVPLIEKKQAKEKHKMANSKRAPKPPRPCKGPSLDTADLKFVKEISELAMKKRARIERMKALKKMKAAKSSSPSSRSSLFAMVITLLFFLVIIFQGFCSGNSSSLQSSPGPSSSSSAANGLITVQLYNNILESKGIRSSSESPNSVEQNSDLLSIE